MIDQLLAESGFPIDLVSEEGKKIEDYAKKVFQRVHSRPYLSRYEKSQAVPFKEVDVLFDTAESLEGIKYCVELTQNYIHILGC